MKRLKYFLGILSMFLGCLFGIQSIYTVTTPVSVIAATKQGWDGDYYYDNGYALKGLQKIGDVYYLFDKTTGKYTGESGKQLYLGSFFKDNKTIQGQMFFTLDGEHLHHIDTGPFYGRDMSFIYKNNSFYGTRTKGAGRTYGFYVQDSSDLKTFNRSSVTNLDFDINGYEGLWAPEWLVDYTGDTTGDYVYYCAKDKNDILRYDADGNPVYRWKIYRAKTESLPDNFVEPELCTFDDYDKKTTIGINSEEANTLGIESRKASPEMLDPAVIKINGQYIMSVKWLGNGAGSEHIDIYTSDNGTSWTFKSTLPCFNGNPIKNDIPTYSNKDIYLTGGAADDTTKFYAADGYEAPTIAYVNGVYYCYVDHYVWTKIDGNEAYEDGYTQADGLSLDGKCYYATSTDLENWTYKGTLESEGYPLRHGSINPVSDEAAAKIMKLYSPVTVTFNNNGANNPEWQKGAITIGTEGNTSLQSSLFWYKRGHIFSSWNTKPDGSGTKYTFRYEDPNTYTNSDFEDVTTELYAQYTPAYTRIRYDKNGGTGAGYTDEFITVDENYIFKENNLTKDGYVFDGYEVNGKTYKPGDKLTEFNATMEPEKSVMYDSGLEDGMWYNQGVTVFTKDNRKCILASYCATTSNAEDRAKDRIWLLVYDFNTGEILQKKLCSTEDTGFNLGHCNGLCWNPDDEYFMTTTQVKLDANLNKIDDVPVAIFKHADGSRFALSGIAYRDQKFYGVSGKWLGVFDRNGNLLEEYDTTGCVPEDFNNSRAFNGQDTGVGEEFLYEHMFIGSACNTYIVVKPKSDLTQTYYFNYLCGNISKASERREVQDSYYDDELDKTYFFSNPSSGAVTDGNTYMLVHDGDAIPTTTVKARWAPATYEINYELDGGINHTDNPSTYSYGSSVTLKNPTKEGYRFVGWNPNDGKISDTDTGDKIFIANWVKQVTVKFVDGQGNILKTDTFDAGSTAVPPENPSRTGYTFAGWDKDYSNVTSDMIITAKWVPNVYNIFYILNGGVLDNKPETYTYGKGLTLGTPVRTGYTFLNWSPNEGVISSTDTGDKTFMANWAQKFIVTFTDGFGKELKTQQVDTGSDATPPADPVKTGYIFDGWDKSYDNVKSDLTVNAKWKAVQKVNVLFLDDKHNTLADTLHYTGMHGESVPLDKIRSVMDDLYNKGYDTNYVLNPIDFDNEEYHDQDIEIYFTPHIETVTTPKTVGSNTDRTGVKYVSGLSKSDISKTFTRTIKYETMKGESLAPKITQSVESKRNAYFNYVTGEVTYDDWSSAKFDSVTSPVIKGYTCDTATVLEEKAVKDETVTVLYDKIIQKANITFKDSKGKALISSLYFEGIEGENIPVPEIEKFVNKLKNKGYDTDYVLKDMVFDGDVSSDQNINIVFTEHIETISQAKTVGSNTDRTDIVYSSGLSDSDLNKILTRKIYYKDTNGEELRDKVIQTVKKSRTAHFNYVTGEVSYSDWSKASFSEVKSPVIDDLICDKSVVYGADAVSDVDVTVTYNKIPQKGSVRFTDGTKDIAPKEVLNGFNAESITYRPDITVMALMNKGYDVVDNNFPKNPVYDRDVDADQDYVIEFRPHIEHITYENSKLEGMRTDRSDVVYSSGLNESDLSKTITRRIKFVDESGREIKDSHIQEAVLTRSAEFNYVTGEVVYSDWSTSEFEKFTVPGILGYTRDTDEIESKIVDINSEDETVVVNYKKVSETVISDSDSDISDAHDETETDTEVDDDSHIETISEKVKDTEEIDKKESDITDSISSETASETALPEKTKVSGEAVYVQESDKNKDNTVTVPSVGDSFNPVFIVAGIAAGTGVLVCSVFLIKRKR